MILKHKHLNYRILLIAAFAGEDHVRAFDGAIAVTAGISLTKEDSSVVQWW